MKNGYPQFAALDMAIVNDQKAHKWLIKNKFEILARFAMAAQGDNNSIKWFAINNLHIYIRLAKKIKIFTDNQKFDYHKLHF